jgi:hypothetical protein
MNKRRRRSNQTKDVQAKKIIRCTQLMRPVYEHECCAEYEKDTNNDTQKSCKTCKHGS